MNIYANATHTRMYLLYTQSRMYKTYASFYLLLTKIIIIIKNFTTQNHGKISQDAETIIIYLLSTAQYITVIRFIATVFASGFLMSVSKDTRTILSRLGYIIIRVRLVIACRKIFFVLCVS